MLSLLRAKLGVAVVLTGILSACSAPTVGGEGVKKDPTDDDANGDQRSMVSEDIVPESETGKWTWVDVPESKCANGEPTGIGINRGKGTDLLVFLEGGGACWDKLSCFGVDTASNVEQGYDKESFEAAVNGDALSRGVFDRLAANNPFKDSSIVYVPYCTGDVHSGDATQTIDGKEVHFAGRKNLEAYLAKLVPTFKQASRVTLAGVSAGGFGAAINYWRFQEAFGKTRVDLIDDSGPPFEQSDITLFSTWKQAWNLDGALPPDCSDCRTNIRAVPAYYAKAYPSSRKALLSYDHDTTISLFFVMLPSTFAKGLADLIENTIAPLDRMKYFVPAGSTHMMLRDLTTKANGVELGTWLGQMTTDSPDWTNVRAPADSK